MKAIAEKDIVELLKVIRPYLVSNPEMKVIVRRIDKTIVILEENADQSKINCVFKKVFSLIIRFPIVFSLIKLLISWITTNH